MYLSHLAQEARLRGNRKVKQLYFSKPHKAQARRDFNNLSETDQLYFQVLADQANASPTTTALALPSPAVRRQRRALAVPQSRGGSRSAEYRLDLWTGPAAQTRVPLVKKNVDGAVGGRLATSWRPLDAMAPLCMSAEFGGSYVGEDHMDNVLVSKRPLHPDRVAKSLEESGLTKDGMKDNFEDWSCKICNAADGEEVPIKVDYTTLCPELLCVNEPGNAQLLRMRDTFLRELEMLAAAMGRRLGCKPIQVARHELMILFEVGLPLTKDIVFIGQLCLNNARSGPQEPYQGFVRFTLPSSKTDR